MKPKRELIEEALEELQAIAAHQAEVQALLEEANAKMDRAYALLRKVEELSREEGEGTQAMAMEALTVEALVLFEEAVEVAVVAYRQSERSLLAILENIRKVTRGMGGYSLQG